MDVVGRNLVGRDLVELQRERCCDVLESVPPDAPTLCEGWTAFDLAAHLDALCRDPLSWPGIGLRALAPITTRRAERLQHNRALFVTDDGRRRIHCQRWIARHPARRGGALAQT